MFSLYFHFFRLGEYARNVEVRTLAFDFAAESVDDYDVIKRALNNLEVGVLGL